MEVKNRNRRKWSMLIIGWLLIANSCLSASYKILMMPFSHRSHFSCHFQVARELGLRGHTPYMLISMGLIVDNNTAEEAKKLNITILRYNCTPSIVCPDAFDDGEKFVSGILDKKVSFPEMIVGLRPVTATTAKELLLENEPLMKTLESIGFDLVVIDSTFVSRFYYLLAHRLNVPWISCTNFAIPWRMRAPWLPSFVPGQYSLVTESMNFWTRLTNLVTSITNSQVEETIISPDEVIAEYQKYGSFETDNELSERSKMWLLITSQLLDFAKPLMPNMKEVGGLTARPGKKLPEDLQEFLDGAEKGAILVSFGSMMAVHPDDVLKKFLDAFEQIHGYRIIWRMYNAGVQLPDNIRKARWLPQNDILAHPKMKLFITHCGNNGQFESFYHGVPMLGFPILADQFNNGVRIEYRGFGIAMDIYDFTSEQLRDNILKILNDPEYKRRISRASDIFKSAPQRPAEKAAYWIEHVIKFGSEHLESVGRHLNFYQFYMLDIAAFFLVVGFVLALAIYKVAVEIVKIWDENKSAYKAKKL